MSDGSVNGWGWYFTVYPIMPAAAPMDMLSDRTVLSRPSIDLVTCLLDFKLEISLDRNIVTRLAATLAANAQLSSLGLSFETNDIFFQYSSFSIKFKFVLLQVTSTAVYGKEEGNVQNYLMIFAIQDLVRECGPCKSCVS